MVMHLRLLLPALALGCDGVMMGVPTSSLASRVASSRIPAPLMQQRKSVRYIPESEMQQCLNAAALAQGLDETRAVVLAACGRNIYGIGSIYGEETMLLLERVCIEPAKAGESWALLMLQCLRGKLPRLRSESTATARMAAARRAKSAQ